jgi:hypothetical protein
VRYQEHVSAKLYEELVAAFEGADGSARVGYDLPPSIMGRFGGDGIDRTVSEIVVYARPGCPFSFRLRLKLRLRRLPFREVDIRQDTAAAAPAQARNPATASASVLAGRPIRVRRSSVVSANCPSAMPW